MRYQAVVFDLFGTLADFPVHDLDRVLGEMADVLSVPRAEFLRLWVVAYVKQENGATETIEAGLKGILRSAGVPRCSDGIAEAAFLWRSFQQRILVPRPHVIDSLTQLKSLGYKLGLIGNTPPDVLPVWSESEMAPLFDVAIFSCAVGMRKPDSRIYQLACNRLGVSPENCLFIGDGGSHELTGAANAGMYPVQIQAPDEPPDTGICLGREVWHGPAISDLREVLRVVTD